MKRTILTGLIAGLCIGMLAGCGGSSQDQTSTKLLADGEACAAAWSSTTTYSTAGIKVSRSGRNYTSAFWTLNQDPLTNSGAAGSGQPWVTGYLCGTPTPTPTPTPAPTPTPTPAPTPTGTVTFQNTGTKVGWSNYPQTPQHIGQINDVTSPVYKGSTAIQARQIFVGNDGVRYHAEVVQDTTQQNGADRYYGQVIYIPSNWQFHDQNVTFQQWAPDNNAGPWIMMFIQGTKLRYAKVAGAATGIWDMTDISALRGKWIRVVTHLNMKTSGVFEVWVNGTKVVTNSGDWTTSWASNSSIRWSTGIYCTGWYQNTPTGQSDLSIYHDQLRVATTYSLADPANWN